MKLLLTSAGVRDTSIHDALVDLLGKPIAPSSALCIPTASYPNPGGAGRVDALAARRCRPATDRDRQGLARRGPRIRGTTSTNATWAYRDAHGDWIDPARTYRLRLPGPSPAKNFWSVVVYDLWTRSMLANGQAHASLSTYSPGVKTDADGGVTLYIGPEAPTGQEANWIRTIAGTGWFPIIRLYGPLEPWIERTWNPDDLTAIE